MTSTLSQLACEGGPQVRAEPWPVRRLFGEREKNAVMELFDRAIVEGSHLLGYNGEQETNYCRLFAEMQGGGYADAVNSGTNAVHVALRSLDLEPFSEVIVPPITDPGGVMPVALMQCIPVIADSAPGSFNTAAEQVEARITERTSAILVAHIAGIPVEMAPILELARRHGIPVIEDCAQSHGAFYRGKPVGSHGDVASFSTMFGKHHATGGQGGVVFTREESRYWRIRQIADRGKPFGLEAGHNNVVAALNCNMDEMHAAIGCVQLQRLPAMVAHRRQLARSIETRLNEQAFAFRLVTGPADADASYWFLIFDVDLGRFSVDKATLATAIQAEGIPISPSYWCVPSSFEWYRNRAVFGSSSLPWPAKDFEEPNLPNITATEARRMILGLHEGCGEREVDDLIETIHKVEAAYLR